MGNVVHSENLEKKKYSGKMVLTELLELFTNALILL